MNVSRKISASETWRLVAVFALALVVRLVYNLYIAQHRILDVGDSFYYLTAGRALARLVRESQSVHSFLQHFFSAAHFIPGSFNSFSSLNLSDRLLIDGPIYPSYLAVIFLMAGKAMETTALNINQITFALANSFTDSLLAVAVAFLGEVAFGLVPGLLAGLMWCFYWPAVVNTQQCYGEPVVALLLTLFIGGLFYQSRQAGLNASIDRSQGTQSKQRFAISLLVGLLAGLVMLSKPAFVLLPPLLFCLHLIELSYCGCLRKCAFSFASLFLGIVLVLAPWLFYTSTVSGAPRLVVNRAPGYNLYVGNYLPTDGWKTWPVVPGIPDAVADARKFLEQEATNRPWDFISLLLRKTPRLWAGVWNDFHQSCFGFSYYLQNIFQGLYLLLATLGLAIFTSGKLRQKRSFSFAAAMTITWACAFHFIYVLFEPVPRYAFTAMPLVLTLAAGAIAAIGQALLQAPKKMRQRTALQIVFLILFFIVGCAALYAFKSPVSLFAFFTQDGSLLRAGTAPLLFIFFLGFGWLLGRSLWRLKYCGPISYAVLAKCFVCAGLIAAAAALSDPAFLEWSIKLPSGDNVAVQTGLSLPDLGHSVPPVVYLLVDAQSSDGAPELKIKINDAEASSYPLPFYELASASKDIPTLINLQSRMMDVDERTFRQWWVYPVDSNLFHFGGENRIALSPAYPKTTRFFGDYGSSQLDIAGGETCFFPSLSTFSWSKGFLTADCRDPRVYENVYFCGRAENAHGIAGDKSSRDLGAKLRVRLAVPMPGAIDAPYQLLLQPISLLALKEEKQISGQNPVVFDAHSAPLLTQLCPSSVIHMHAQMRRNNTAVPATMSLSLGLGASQNTYSPIWQPACLRLGKEWADFDFKTILPVGLSSGKSISTQLLLSPYPGDRFYLHRKEALKDSIFVRDLKIELLPPAVPGSGASVLKLM